MHCSSVSDEWAPMEARKPLQIGCNDQVCSTTGRGPLLTVPVKNGEIIGQYKRYRRSWNFFFREIARYWSGHQTEQMGSGCLSINSCFGKMLCSRRVLDGGIGGEDMAYHVCLDYTDAMKSRKKICDTTLSSVTVKFPIYKFRALTPLTHALWKLFSGPDIGTIRELLSGCKLIPNQRSDDEGILWMSLCSVQ